jgi:small subunit ribosomal protein S2
VAEARKKNIPVIAICDTNVNPELVNYPIPANDDATKTVKLILEVIQSAIIDAKKDLKN